MQTPMTLHHEKLGASFGPGHLPLRYQSVDEEYWAVKRGAGIIDISHLGRLILSGKDRISFLNGLVTNDLAQLKDGNGIHSALLNTKGRVVADLYIYNGEAGLVVDTGDSPGSKVKPFLDQFVITEDAQIRDAGEDLLHFTVQGPTSARVLKDALRTAVEPLTQLSSRSLGPSMIIARDRTGVGGYDILLPPEEAEALWQELILRGKEGGAIPVGLEALEILRLEKGSPKYGIDVDEGTIVLEAGFKDAISFTKGCYMGQEVVARATHIGRVNRRLVQVEVESKIPPKPGSKLMTGERETGLITSAAFSPGRAKVVALGYVHRDAAVKGEKVQLNAEGSLFPATVAEVL